MRLNDRTLRAATYRARTTVDNLPLLLGGYTENLLTIRFDFLLTNLEEKLALNPRECRVAGNRGDIAVSELS